MAKLFIWRMQGKLKYKNLIVVGEDLFSEMEFPSVAEKIEEMAEPYSFQSYARAA